MGNTERLGATSPGRRDAWRRFLRLCIDFSTLNRSDTKPPSIAWKVKKKVLYIYCTNIYCIYTVHGYLGTASTIQEPYSGCQSHPSFALRKAEL